MVGDLYREVDSSSNRLQCKGAKGPPHLPPTRHLSIQLGSGLQLPTPVVVVVFCAPTAHLYFADVQPTCGIQGQLIQSTQHFPHHMVQVPKVSCW